MKRATAHAAERSYRVEKAVGRCELVERRDDRVRVPWTLAGQYLIEIEQIINRRYGPAGVDTDDADRLLQIALNHLVIREQTLRARAMPRGPLEDLCREWARRWTPGATSSEVDHAMSRAISKPRHYRSDTMARHLGVTDAERRALGLKTIGAIDYPKSARERDRKEADRQRKAASRVAVPGRQSREEYEASSDAALARELGCSRRTIIRHRAAGTLATYMAKRKMSQVCPTYKNSPSYIADTPVTSAIRIVERPAEKAGRLKRPGPDDHGIAGGAR